MYMCLYVCIYVCMYVYMYVYVHTYTHRYIHTYKYIHTYVYTYCSMWFEPMPFALMYPAVQLNTTACSFYVFVSVMFCLVSNSFRFNVSKKIPKFGGTSLLKTAVEYCDIESGCNVTAGFALNRLFLIWKSVADLSKRQDEKRRT